MVLPENDFIIGLESRPCVNGLTKSDFKNVKNIPQIAYELSTLSQNVNNNYATKTYVNTLISNLGGEWVNANFSSSNYRYNIITDNNKFIKEVIIIYNDTTKDGSFAGCIYIPKNTLFSELIFKINYCYKETVSSKQYFRIGTVNVTTVDQWQHLIQKDDFYNGANVDRVYLGKSGISINKTDNVIDFDSNSFEVLIFYRPNINIYYR